MLLAVWLLAPLPWGYFRTAGRPDPAESSDNQPPPERYQDRRTHVYPRRTRIRPPTAVEIISGYYAGRRIWYGPLTAAGRPGRAKVQYTASPGIFPPAYAGNRMWCVWSSDDQEKFPWEITVNDTLYTPAHLRGPELLGLWQTAITSFRYVGDDSNGAID